MKRTLFSSIVALVILGSFGFIIFSNLTSNELEEVSKMKSGDFMSVSPAVAIGLDSTYTVQCWDDELPCRVQKK